MSPDPKGEAVQAPDSPQGAVQAAPPGQWTSVALVLAIPLSLIALAALEALFVLTQVAPPAGHPVLAVFLLGVEGGREVLWAPLLYQVFIAGLLALAQAKARLRWMAVGLAGLASAAIVLHLYGVLTSYLPFRGQLGFVAAYVGLLFFLAWWVVTLLPEVPKALGGRGPRLLARFTPLLALAGFSAVYLLNATQHPDDYLELHYSALQVCYLLLHAGLVGLLARARRLPALPRLAQLATLLALGGLLAAGHLFSRAESQAEARSTFRRFTTLGRSLAYDRPASVYAAPAGKRAPDDPLGETRFARHSGFPPLPASFALERFHVLLVTIETLRYRDTSLADPALETSPNLLRFAQAGRHWFTQASTPAPYTLQTLASLFAMTYPSMTNLVLGYNSWDGTLPPESHLVPEILKESGYSTFWIGHNHEGLFGRLVHGLEQGFEEVWRSGHNDPKADVQILQKILSALEKRRLAKQRFFGWVFLESPHHDYVAHYDHLPKATKRDRYRQEIRFADEQLGKLFAYLDQTGLIHETVVILHGDHGEELGEHGGWHHTSLYSEVTHVPLVIHIPGFPGRVQQAPTSLAYLFPWLLAKGPPSARRVTRQRLIRDFGPMLRDTGNAVVIERLHRHHPRVALVYPHKRLVYDLASRYFELFDTRADPGEQKNAFVRGTAESRQLTRQVNGYLRVVSSRRRFRYAKL